MATPQLLLQLQLSMVVQNEYKIQYKKGGKKPPF